jgi:hypothetical protein
MNAISGYNNFILAINRRPHAAGLAPTSATSPSVPVTRGKAWGARSSAPCSTCRAGTRKLGFMRMTTAMAIFEDQALAVERGYLSGI